MSRSPNLDPELLLWPRLTRFYGITPSELARLPRWLVRLYIEALDSLYAKEQLDAIQAGTAAYMESADADSLQRNLVRRANALTVVPEREARRNDPAPDRARLSAMGIAVVKKDAKSA